MKILRGLSLLLPLTTISAQAAEPDNTWKLIPVSSGQKLTALSPGILEAFKPEPIQLQVARGEWENFQFVVTAGEKPIEKLEINPNGFASVIADFIPSGNLEIYRENYVYVAKPSGNRDLTRKWWPDALIPQNLAPSSIEAGKSAVFWASLKIPDDAVPGDYYGEIDFLSDGDPRRLAVALTVSDAKLPPPTLRGTVALYYNVLRDWYAKDGQTFTDVEWQAEKKRYYDFLLDYRINAYDLPVAWDSPEVEGYLTDPRVLSVRTPPLDSPDFPIALEKFKATRTLAKAFYYRIDEPTPDKYPQVIAASKKLRESGIKQLVTTHPNQALKDAVEIWCPNVGDFFGIGHVDAKALETERKKGHETWMYTMVEPKFPYPTWLLDDDAAAVRAYGPLMTRYGFTGFVYSMCHGWGPRPLENLESFANTNGDGTLLYPAEVVGGVGPMPSIRLMLLRDAMEDVELKRVAATVVPSPSMRRIGVPSTTVLKRSGAPETKVAWRLDKARESLVVNFRASKPERGDYVVVELAPLAIDKKSEKWRFVMTRDGKSVAEKWTREGQFVYEVKGFKANVKAFPDYYTVEAHIPLLVVDDAPRFRFDVSRRTSIDGTKITLHAFSSDGDPYRMPLIDSTTKVTPAPRKKTSKFQIGGAKPPARAKI